MNKAALADALARKQNLPRKQSIDIIETVVDTIVEELQKGNEVVLAGFGTFSAKRRHARMGVNPQSPTERIKIPEVRVPKFKAGSVLKKALKSSKESAAPAESLPTAQ